MLHTRHKTPDVIRRNKPPQTKRNTESEASGNTSGASARLTMQRIRGQGGCLERGVLIDRSPKPAHKSTRHRARQRNLRQTTPWRGSSGKAVNIEERICCRMFCESMLVDLAPQTRKDDAQGEMECPAFRVSNGF
eukprot:508296-Rhodomonas_salina.1